MILWICVGIGVVVFGAMFYSMWKFRKVPRRCGRKLARKHRQWKLCGRHLPLIILIIVAVPATKALIMMEDVANADMTVKVTGYQWKWHYDYVDHEGVDFFSTISQDSNEARRKDSGIDPFSVQNYLARRR